MTVTHSIRFIFFIYIYIYDIHAKSFHPVQCVEMAGEPLCPLSGSLVTKRCHIYSDAVCTVAEAAAHPNSVS